MDARCQSEIAWLQSLTSAQRASFLGLLAHGLTIATRVLCHSAGGSGEALEQVRQLNEAQHQVVSYLLHYLAGDEDVQFVRRVVQSSFEIQDAPASQQVLQAWSYAKREFNERVA